MATSKKSKKATAKKASPKKASAGAKKATAKKASPKKASPKKASARAARPARAGKAPKRAGGPRRMFEKVAFTMFWVQDATRARAFYEDVLGLTRGSDSTSGFWTEYDLPGGGCLALFKHPDPSAARPAGGASLAFEVADLDALNERLREAGVRYESDVIYGPNCRMSNILDSEGNALILHELNGKR